VEQYGLDELVASADAVLAGLGPLAAGLAGLAGLACGAVTLDAMELLVTGQGRELLRGVVQLGLDTQAAAEVRVREVTGADGVRRGRAEPCHARPVVTTLGEVSVRRIAYRSGIREAGSLFPRDAVLNLPPCGYSWELQQVIAAAAADAEWFYQDPARPRDEPVLPGAGPDGSLPPLVISADGKGVAMRPEARRRYYGKKAQRAQTFGKRLGTGEKKGHKRIAETACVFDVIAAERPRTPEQVMGPDPGSAKNAPRGVNRWYACDITASCDVTIGKGLDEAARRDPGHQRTWLFLADGDRHQIASFQAGAAERDITPVILIDFVHVLGYLRKAAWCFHAPRDPAAEDWVTAQGLDILHGRVAEVISRIRQLAACHPPRPGSEHAKIIRTTLSYLENKQPWMDYPAALAAGWPIATGVIEGACRHLVQDRMGITGARWGLDGAQAMLWLRALHASGDHSAYWDYRIEQEHQRNHLSRFKDGLGLTA
jgi:hypothetical protein